MTLILTKELRVWWPAKITQPTDGGRLVEYEIELHLKVPQQHTLRDLVAFAEGDKEEALNFENAWIQNHVLDWRGVHSEKKQPLTYSAEKLELLLDVAGGRKGVVTSLLNAAHCWSEAVKKTSSPSPNGGPAATTKLN